MINTNITNRLKADDLTDSLQVVAHDHYFEYSFGLFEVFHNKNSHPLFTFSSVEEAEIFIDGVRFGKERT